MGIGENKTSRGFKDVPFELVLELCQLYEVRDGWTEDSGVYEECTEKIKKVKAVLEYIATGGIN
nr:MAG TPA: hypothetical protein [Caudoviricetes sp.]